MLLDVRLYEFQAFKGGFLVYLGKIALVCLTEQAAHLVLHSFNDQSFLEKIWSQPFCFSGITFFFIVLLHVEIIYVDLVDHRT